MKTLVLATALSLAAGAATATEVITENLMDLGDGAYTEKVAHYFDVGLVCLKKRGGNQGFMSCFTYEMLGAERLAVMGIEPNPAFPVSQ